MTRYRLLVSKANRRFRFEAGDTGMQVFVYEGHKFLGTFRVKDGLTPEVRERDGRLYVWGAHFFPAPRVYRSTVFAIEHAFAKLVTLGQ